MAKNPLSAAIAALERALAPSGRHMIIGGVAVIARGVRRLTDDVDATLWGEGVDLEKLVRRLASYGIVPRVADALAFARQNQVLLLRHQRSDVDVDLSLAWLPFEKAALERAQSVAIGKHRVRVARPEDLVVYKAIAARERDLSDVERLLERHASAMDLPRVRRTVEELAGVLDRPDLVDGFDRIVRRVIAEPRTARARATDKRPTRRRSASKRP